MPGLKSLILNAIGSCTNTMKVNGGRSRTQLDKEVYTLFCPFGALTCPHSLSLYEHSTKYLVLSIFGRNIQAWNVINNCHFWVATAEIKFTFH